MRSPKDKFSGKVCFVKPLKGVGSEVIFTADSVEQIKAYAEQYNSYGYTLYISENKKVYPEFEWVKIDVIKHELNRGGKRKGAGRPSKYEGEKKAINLKLTTAAIKKLTSAAESADISRSDMVNFLIFENL